MGPGWRVGRLAGIDLAIHPSWLVIAFLVTYSLAEFQFPFQFRGWSPALYWGVAVATALLFFGRCWPMSSRTPWSPGASG